MTIFKSKLQSQARENVFHWFIVMFQKNGLEGGVFFTACFSLPSILKRFLAGSLEDMNCDVTKTMSLDHSFPSTNYPKSFFVWMHSYRRACLAWPALILELFGQSRGVLPELGGKNWCPEPGIVLLGRNLAEDPFVQSLAKTCSQLCTSLKCASFFNTVKMDCRQQH